MDSNGRYNKLKMISIIISLILSIVGFSYMLYKEFYVTADIKIEIEDAEVIGMAYYDTLEPYYVPYWVKLRALAINTGNRDGHIMKFFLENIKKSEEISKYIDQVSLIKDGSLVDQIHVRPRSSESFSILVKIWKRNSYDMRIYQQEVTINGSYIYFNGKDLASGSVFAPALILSYDRVGGGSFITRYGYISWEGPIFLLKEEQIGKDLSEIPDITLFFPKLPIIGKVVIPPSYHYYWNVTNLNDHPLTIEHVILALYFPNKECSRILSPEVMRAYYLSDIENEIIEPQKSKSLNLTRILRQVEEFKESAAVIKIYVTYSDSGKSYTKIWSICYRIFGG